MAVQYFSETLDKEFKVVRGMPSWFLKTRGSHLSSSKTLVFIVPGNPGVVDYYKEFAEVLHDASNQRLPVWGLSHGGHMVHPKNVHCKNGEVYSLEDQIEQKIAFLEENVPEDTQLILVGHSIGCYIILEMMKRKPELPVLRALLLFPTIERMKESPNGRLAAPLALYFRWLAVLACYVASVLPQGLKEYLVSCKLDKNEVGQFAIDATLHLFHPSCLSNVIYMGGNEMVVVSELDVECIQKNLHRITFYYGQTDAWCPMLYYHDIKKGFPEGDIRLDQFDMPHAFCLGSSKKMAQLVWDWIKDEVEL